MDIVFFSLLQYILQSMLKKYFFEYLEKQEENLNKSGILTAMRM